MMIEPYQCDARDFSQAANRLEILRGIPNAPNELLVRFLRRFKKLKIRDLVERRDFVFTDLGPSDD